MIFINQELAIEEFGMCYKSPSHNFDELRVLLNRSLFQEELCDCRVVPQSSRC
jgi:hypothetical protein